MRNNLTTKVERWFSGFVPVVATGRAGQRLGQGRNKAQRACEKKWCECARDGGDGGSGRRFDTDPSVGHPSSPYSTGRNVVDLCLCILLDLVHRSAVVLCAFQSSRVADRGDAIGLEVGAVQIPGKQINFTDSKVENRCEIGRASADISLNIVQLPSL